MEAMENTRIESNEGNVEKISSLFSKFDADGKALMHVLANRFDAGLGNLLDPNQKWSLLKAVNAFSQLEPENIDVGGIAEAVIILTTAIDCMYTKNYVVMTEEDRRSFEELSSAVETISDDLDATCELLMTIDAEAANEKVKAIARVHTELLENLENLRKLSK